MSTSPSLTFNDSKECIEGFHDFRSKTQKNKMADHVCLKSKTKQRTAYTFSSKKKNKKSQN